MERIKFGFYWLILPLFVLSSQLINISGQDLNPIRWEIKNESVSVKVGETFNLQVVALIDEGWHLYSPEQPAGGPIPTRILLGENQKFKINGEIESPLPQVVFDPNFNMDTQFYEQEAVFTLPVEALQDALSGKNTLTVTTFYQTCNEKTCLPPKTVKLTTEIVVTGGTQTVITTKSTGQTTDPLTSQTSINSEAKAVEFDFVDFTGKPRKISEFRGKFVLLDFWATWCSPCLADIPKLKVLYEKYKEQGFEIVGMDSETIGEEEDPDPEFAKETAERAKQIVKTRGAVWTQATTETAVPIAKQIFGVKALPTKILLNKEGKIIATIGEKDDLNGIIEKLLKGGN
jgi:thiol:disulfide interchange protein DsbD